MQSQQLFEAPFASEVGTEYCPKGIRAGKCMCKRCQGEASPPLHPNFGSNPGYKPQWLFEAPFPSQVAHYSASTQENYMDAMTAPPFSSRPLSPTYIAKLTKQIEDRMRALSIPAQYIGIKGIPGESGRGFDPNMRDAGGNVRTRGIAVGAGVLEKIPGWGAWNKASLKTRIDAVIAHEWAEFNGATHEKARDKAAETELPISEAAKRLLRNQKDRGAPEMAHEYDGEAIERSFRPIRPLSPWPRLLNQTTQAIRNAITHLKSPQNLRAFDNALTSAEYLLNKAATEIQKVITDSPSVPRQSRVLGHLGNAWNRINAARAQARATTDFGERSFINPAISLHGAIEQIQQARQAVGLQ